MCKPLGLGRFQKTRSFFSPLWKKWFFFFNWQYDFSTSIAFVGSYTYVIIYCVVIVIHYYSFHMRLIIELMRHFKTMKVGRGFFSPFIWLMKTSKNKIFVKSCVSHIISRNYCCCSSNTEKPSKFVLRISCLFWPWIEVKLFCCWFF